MQIHLVDGTYELFRHFYGNKRGSQAPAPMSAVVGVLGTVTQMLESGATHLGVATDHVIESFRNDLYPGYKRGDGIDPDLWAQFHPLEAALSAMGVLAWPMVEFEADDALAAAAHRANLDAGVRQVSIWTPDKDLAQCVVGDRVVQVDRRSGQVRNAAGVLEKFGVPPSRIPDYLALVGDNADGYRGIAGIGAKTAARLLTKHGAIEDFPDEVLGDQREDALLYKRLATLRTDVPVFTDIDELRWKGPRPEFDRLSRELGASHLAAKVAYVARNG